MDGQWMLDDEPDGQVTIIDIDDRVSFYSGAITAVHPKIPGGIITQFRTNDHGVRHDLDLNFSFFHPNSGNIISHKEMASLVPAFQMPEIWKIYLELDQDKLVIGLNSETPKELVKISKSKSCDPSNITVEESVKSWSDFKKYVEYFDLRRYVFRGQASTWKLRTSFHRTHRKDIYRFISDDIVELHRTLSSVTKHIFNLNDNLQNGAFWNLVQHHGYPTPLLDWSYSPFVAAFFAFKQKPIPDGSDKVRILIFDKEAWRSDYRQIQSVINRYPHLSVLEAHMIENNRAIPQQALSTITNIDDIESYIERREKESGKIYLRAVDISVSEREIALKDLAFMGITSGSLFPGLDGMCDDLKCRFFGYK